MAVALAADPKLLLLDEPFTGMNAEETRRMMRHVRQLRDERGITIMLVEHDMQAVMGLCDAITVMNFGSEAGGGNAGGGAQRSARRSKPISAVPTMLLEIRDLHCPLPEGRGAEGRRASTCRAGGIVTIIGSNGAGKSTTLRTISGPRAALGRRNPLRRRAHRQAAAGEDRRARHRACAGRAPRLSGPDCGGESPHRRLPAQGQRRRRRRTSTTSSRISRA